MKQEVRFLYVVTLRVSGARCRSEQMKVLPGFICKRGEVGTRRMTARESVDARMTQFTSVQENHVNVRLASKLASNKSNKLKGNKRVLNSEC